MLRHSEDLDFENPGRGVPNYLGRGGDFAGRDVGLGAVKKDNIKRARCAAAPNLNHQNTVRAISSRIDLQTQYGNFWRSHRSRQRERRERGRIRALWRITVCRAGNEPRSRSHRCAQPAMNCSAST